MFLQKKARQGHRGLAALMGLLGQLVLMRQDRLARVGLREQPALVGQVVPLVELAHQALPVQQGLMLPDPVVLQGQKDLLAHQVQQVELGHLAQADQ